MKIIRLIPTKIMNEAEKAKVRAYVEACRKDTDLSHIKSNLSPKESAALLKRFDSQRKIIDDAIKAS